MSLSKIEEWDHEIAHEKVQKMIDSHSSTAGDKTEMKHYIMYLRQARCFYDAFADADPNHCAKLNTDELKFAENITNLNGDLSIENVTKCARRVRDANPKTFGEELNFEHFAECLVLNKKIINSIIVGHPALENASLLQTIVMNALNDSTEYMMDDSD